MLELLIIGLAIISLTAIIFFIAGYLAGRAYEHVAVEELIERYYAPEEAAPVDNIPE